MTYLRSGGSCRACVRNHWALGLAFGCTGGRGRTCFCSVLETKCLSVGSPIRRETLRPRDGQLFDVTDRDEPSSILWSVTPPWRYSDSNRKSLVCKTSALPITPYPQVPSSSRNVAGPRVGTIQVTTETPREGLSTEQLYHRY